MLRKANIGKTTEQDEGTEMHSRIFLVAFQNIFLNGKYCFHNFKLLPTEQKGNIKEAFFDKAELACTVLPLLWASDKIHHVVWPDSGDNWILPYHALVR